ncbi:CoA transferase [Frankia sp. R43]|uniref:CoA transferase n=1 Tax=Frankia sp. R43 TaxID=269536 RepID=UPI00350F8C75
MSGDRSASRSSRRSPRAGRPTRPAPAAALTEGFKLGFVITAVTMVVGVLAALLLFREDGRGEKVDLAAVQSAAIEGG